MRKLLLLILLFPLFAHGQGTQIVTVASDPATCKEGMIYANSTTHTQKLCGPANTWASVGGVTTGGTGVVTAAQLLTTYGAGQGNFVVDASTTSGNNVVTCPDCKFQTGLVPATVGMIFFATDSTASGACVDNPTIQFGGLNQTTISTIDSDSQIHVVGNAGTTSTGKACAVYGPDSTTALNTAWQGNGCGVSLFLPGGVLLFQQPIFQAISGCPNINTNVSLGNRIVGANVQSSWLIPTPNFNFTPIIGLGTGASAAGAVGTVNVASYENFTIYGSGVRCPSSMANTTLLVSGPSARTISVDGSGWCARGGGASLIGHYIGASGGTQLDIVGGTNFFGSIGLYIDSQLITVGNGSFAGNNVSVNGTCLYVLNTNATMYSFSNNMTGCWQLNAGSILNSINTNVVQSAGTNEDCMFANGANVRVNFLGNDRLCSSAGGTGAGINANSQTGLVVNALNSIIGGGSGGGNCIKTAASSTFLDQGGNTFPSCTTRWNALGVWAGDGSVTGTAQIAGNIALTSGWGSSTVGTVSGNTKFERWIVTGAGSPGANPVITVTFPVAFTATPVCQYLQQGGTFGVITTPAITTTTTAATLTFVGTPVAAQTYTMSLICGAP